MELLRWMSFSITVLLLCSFTRGDDICTVTDNAPCIKGTNHTITCEMRRRYSVVKWLNGNDGQIIIYSDKNSCHLNPAFERKYNHSCDLDKNIFNLTILNVNEDDNKNKFVCSDVKKSGCTIIILGEYEQRLDDTGNGIITVVSACSSDKNVTFKWIKIDPINGEEVEFNPMTLNKSKTICLDECGNSRHMKYTEAISVASSGNGKKYHLKVAVFYGAVRIVSNETRVAYMIEEHAEDTKCEDSSLTAVAAIAVIAAAVVVAVVVFLVMFCRKRVMFFNRAEIPINQEEESESGEESALNSGDSMAGLREPEAKIEEKVELMSQSVNEESNQGSDNGDSLAGLREPEAKKEEKLELMSQSVNEESNQGSDSGDSLAGLREPEAKIEEKVELMSQSVNEESNKGSDNGTPSVNLEEDQQTESSLPSPDFYLPMKDTKGNSEYINC